MFDPGAGDGGDGGLGVKGDAEPRFFQHREIVGAVADGQRLLRRQTEFIAQRKQHGALAGAPEDRLMQRPGQAAPFDRERVAVVPIEAGEVSDMSGEQGEAARRQRGRGTMRPHGADQVGGAGLQRDPVDHPRRGRDIESSQESDTFAKRGIERDLAAHRALRDGRHRRSHAGGLRELVDAFLVDDRRIHVGDEEAFAAMRSGLHDHVDGDARERLAEAFRPPRVAGTGRRCERDVGGDGPFEPSRDAGFGQYGSGQRQDVGRQRFSLGDQSCDVRHDDRPEAILIAGPTASGKSALALDLARRLGGVLINADSMQVYHDLRIITARPSATDERCAPHVLFGTVDGDTTYSVSRWLADAARELQSARDRDLLPIVVGGTGLYFKALTQGLSAIPPVPDAVRTELRNWATGRPVGDLHAALAVLDPIMAGRLRPTDPQRLIRALEVHRATGRSLAEFQERREPPILDIARCRAVYLTLERSTLREHIDRRFDRMIADGALDEVERLVGRGLDPDLPVMRTLGVPPLMGFLRGFLTRSEALAAAKTQTRAYAKRQDTFARHQLPLFRPVPPEAAEAELLRH